MESALGKTGINNARSSSPSVKTATNILRLDAFMTPFIYSVYFRFDHVDTRVSRLSYWLGSRQYGRWVAMENKPSLHGETICFLPPSLFVTGVSEQEGEVCFWRHYSRDGRGVRPRLVQKPPKSFLFKKN